MLPWALSDDPPIVPCGDTLLNPGLQTGDSVALGARAGMVKCLLALKEGRPFPELRGSAGEAAWDILMDLYVNEMAGRATSVTSACIGSRVPPTTALRYVNALCDSGRVERHRDANDARRYWLKLPQHVIAEIDAYIAAMIGELTALLKPAG